MIVRTIPNNAKRGFTLVEILVVIAIIGILAAIAIPTYNNYLIRSRAAELVHLTGNPKSAISEFRVSKGTFPATSADIGLGAVSSKYVRSVSISSGGVITVVGNVTNIGSGAAIGLTLTPTFSNGSVTWVCTGTGETQYLPGSCK